MHYSAYYCQPNPGSFDIRSARVGARQQVRQQRIIDNEITGTPAAELRRVGISVAGHRQRAELVCLDELVAKQLEIAQGLRFVDVQACVDNELRLVDFLDRSEEHTSE